MASTKTKTDRLQQNQLVTYDAQGFGNGETISSTPSYLLKAYVINKSAGVLWLAFFNATTASGTPAVLPVSVPASGIVQVDFSQISGAGFMGISFPTALTWAASTAAAFNQDASSSLWLTAIYA
jgi:hypothetical protein